MYLFSYRVQSKYSLITHTAVRDIINEKFPVSLNISQNHFIKLHCIPYKLQIFFCTLFDQYKGANINRTFFYCTGFFNEALDHLLVKSHYSKQIFFQNTEMKTSRSCQRRINFLCKNESVMTKLKVIVGEMKFDEEIYQKFGVSKIFKLSARSAW